MRYIIISILLLPFGVAHGQERMTWDIDSIATSYAHTLVDDGITDQAFIIERGCHGCESIEGCDCYDGSISAFIIWIENGVAMLKNIECCSNHQKIKLPKIPTFYIEGVANKDKLFGSRFKEDYIEVHNFFNYLKVIDSTGKREIRIFHYYFNPDHKYSGFNKKQYAKLFLDKVTVELNHLIRNKE